MQFNIYYYFVMCVMLLNSSNNNNNNIHLFIDLLLLNNTRNCIFTISLQNNSFLQLNWNRQNVIEQKFIQMLYICKFHFPYLYTAEQWEVRAWSWCSFNSHYYSRLLVPHNSHIFSHYHIWLMLSWDQEAQMSRKQQLQNHEHYGMC